MTHTELINQTMEVAQTLTEKELDSFMTLMAITMIAMIRGSKGDEFVNDFLRAALGDEDPMRITPVRLQ
jgi:hypothetical protein